MAGLPKVAVVDACNNKQHKIVEQQELYKSKKDYRQLVGTLFRKVLFKVI